MSGIRFASSMSLSRRLILAMIGAAALSAALIASTSVWIAREGAVADAERQLEEARTVRSGALEAFSETLVKDLVILTEMREVVRSIGALSESLELAEQANGAGSVERAYIDDNPHPIGEKDKLLRAKEDTPYNAAHAEIHSTLSHYLDARGYYDIFLINPEGRIVYSVFKERDFTKSLTDGPLASSGLAKAFRGALATKPGDFTFADFEPYAPSGDAPAAFIAAPVQEPGAAAIAGVVAVQVPSDKLREALQAVSADAKIGTFAVGPDGLLRTDTPYTDYEDTLRTSFALNETLMSAEGVVEGVGITGEEAMLTQRRIDFLGADWVVVSQETKAKAYELADQMARSMMLAALAALLVPALLAWRFGVSLARPVIAMKDSIEKLTRGENVAIPGTQRGDEIGDLARSMGRIHENAVEAQRVRAALDAASSAVMVADADFRIVYSNPTLTSTLMESRAWLEKRTKDPSVGTEGFVGRVMDVFHTNPAAIRERMAHMRETEGLEVTLDDRLFVLSISPIRDSAGAVNGYVVEWEEKTEARRIERDIAGVIAAVSAGDLSRRLDIASKDPFLQDIARGLNDVCAIMEGFMNDLDGVLRKTAEGDLTGALATSHQGRFAEIGENLNAALARLGSLVRDIQGVSTSMRSQVSSVREGAQELASRAEQQAAALEETAATMDEMAATVRANAESAQRAESISNESASHAQEFGDAMSEAIEAIQKIEVSSQNIADIIGVIDGIAFQTNLLALNAAVEAARAGDAGKGFAVVASEVRTLAQRSADAARDIKSLIDESGAHVSDGVRVVKSTETALEKMREAAANVAATVSEIASATSQQAAGVQEISATVSHMDDMTQRNAAMADDSVRAAQTLDEQAERLKDLTARFLVEEAASQASAAEAVQDEVWRTHERLAGGADSAAAAAHPAPQAAFVAHADEQWDDF